MYNLFRGGGGVSLIWYMHIMCMCGAVECEKGGGGGGGGELINICQK